MAGPTDQRLLWECRCSPFVQCISAGPTRSRSCALPLTPDGRRGWNETSRIQWSSGTADGRGIASRKRTRAAACTARYDFKRSLAWFWCPTLGGGGSEPVCIGTPFLMAWCPRGQAEKSVLLCRNAEGWARPLRGLGGFPQSSSPMIARAATAVNEPVLDGRSVKCGLKPITSHSALSH